MYPSNVPRTGVPRESEGPRHSAVVRVTHWITTLAFFALLLTGIEIVISHPRFYWGETGNVNMAPLFSLHIPASRDSVPTGFHALPDQNGWSRYLHFEAAWVLVLTGMVYVAISLWNGHFRKDLLPARGDRSWRAFRDVIARYLGRAEAEGPAAHAYNVMQRTAYLAVIFVLFPLIIGTGLALSPAFNSAFPLLVNALGGRQSARTLHFFVSGALVLFVITHVAMVIHAGFRSRVRGMIVGPRTRLDRAQTTVPGNMPAPAQRSRSSAVSFQEQKP